MLLATSGRFALVPLHSDCRRDFRRRKSTPLFEQSPPRNRGGPELLAMLLRGVGARIMLGDERAIAVGRREALGPDDPEPLIAALALKDADWVSQHAEAIVRSCPTAGLPILISLRQLGRDILNVGERIAPIASQDERFLVLLERFIDDPAHYEAIRRAADDPETT